MDVMRIKELREQKGLSQQQLAELLGLSSGAIGMWESGKREPSKKSLDKLSEIFDVSVEYLLGNSDIRKTADEIISNSNDVLSEKNKKDIAKQMQSLRDSLKNSEGLMFNGDELNEETKDLLLTAIEKDIEAATIINKKYTPKKYRK